MKELRQRALCCLCGRTDALALSLCGTAVPCGGNEEYFEGLRELVLRRDGHRCRVCEGLKPGVHHRVPRMSKLHLMIAFCVGCHAKVHGTKCMLKTVNLIPLLLVLWREQHPDSHEQKSFKFKRREDAAMPQRL